MDEIWSSPIHRKELSAKREKRSAKRFYEFKECIYSKRKRSRLISKPNYRLKKQL